jgi:hypothetical protein
MRGDEGMKVIWSVLVGDDVDGCLLVASSCAAVLG